MKFKLLCLFVCSFTLMTNAQNATVSEAKKTISLFDGERLDGWEGDQRVWSAENGCIVGRTTDEVVIAKNTFLIYETAFSDFELSFNYKIIGGNSGVQYRSKIIDTAEFVVGGYQADMEAGVQYSGILYEEQGRGILALRGKEVVIAENGEKTETQFSKSEEIQAAIHQDQWNHYRIIAKGNHLQHFINGHKTIDVVDNETSKHSKAGVIALQVHKGPNMVVSYKDIVVKEIEK